MAANKFATLLHRNTNAVVVTLVYAVLEWVLILLLLLNSLFSYLITKFAKWVGLKPPCPFCSRLDHVLEPGNKSKILQSDLVCEAHAAEISNTGFCSNHGKMAETQSMCEDCLASIRGIAFVSWLSSEKTERCSCCNKSLRTPYTSKGTIIVEASLDDDEEEEEGDKECEHQILSDIESFILREVAEDRSSSVSKDAEKDEKEDDLTEMDPRCGTHNLLHHFSESVWEDRSFEVINLHFENNAAGDNNHRVIPVGLIDSSTSANFESGKSEENSEEKEQKIETSSTESSIEAELSMVSLKNFMVSEDEELTNDGNNVDSATEEQDDAQEDQTSTTDDDAEVQNAFDEFIAQNNTQGTKKDEKEDEENTQGPVETGATDNEYAETILVEENHEETSHHQSSKFSEADEEEEEEDKLPETPSSVDGLHYLHRKLLLLEKTESGAAEDSLDGSETENGDSASTIEKLKTALKTERKALRALYQELEEERSASAIAANQTMAMITRLQEEKAGMQMEALQYQRMMEEQSEYDQEALQLLNDLMVKREKEKQELEKEVEEYKQKVMDFEAKEKLRVLRRMKNGSVKSRESSSFPSSSSMGDTEELSIDLNCEAREDDNNNTTTTAETVSSLEEMTVDCVKHMSALDSSLAEFEEEKLSILDQLKALEEKLITLGDNEQFLDDFNEKCFFSSPEEDMYSNVFPDDKQCYSPRRSMGSLAKRLLPYLDAADDDVTEEAYSCERQEENSGPTDSAMKVSIKEEVDHVYERLQALETDTDFLRHYMGSIEKGDKGMDHLQEILQHLRDLKAVELRLKDLDDDDDDLLR